MDNTTPSCPNCRGPMVLRQSHRGPFFGCKAFPRCRGIVDVAAASSGRKPTPPGGVDLSAIPVGALPAVVAARVLALDADQAAVAGHRIGEGVAAAAAGSGKSTVLVERTADLLSEGVLPEAVLLLTFNRDAALSLRGKLVERLGAEGAGRVRALTYHAYCLGLLKRWFPQDRRWSRIIGAPESEAPSKASIFRPILRDLRLQGEADEWANIDERVREAGIDPQATDAVEQVAASRWGDGSLALGAQIVDVMRAYAGEKRDRQAVDFTDLLCMVAAEFALGTPRARDAACFAHVMIDEAQDTNVVQQRIAQFLGAPAKSLLWVGDLRQSIYGWRGAAPQLLTDRVDAGTALLPIRTCRRSTVAIVEAGNSIARGRDWHLGGDSVARTDAPEGRKPVARRGGASDVADEVAAAVGNGASPADFAALARVNSALPDLECSLVARGLPVRVLGSKGGVWDTQVGRCVRAYLHASEGRAQDLSRISNRPLRFVKGDTIRQVEAEVSRGRDLVGSLRAQTDRGAQAMAWDIRDLAALPYADCCERIAALLIRDVEERAAGLKTDPDEDRLETVRALCRAANELGSVQAIEEQVTALKNAKDDAPAVTLATTHRSKGAEFGSVFVLAGAEHFPHARAEDADEERRLWYVATTRAKTSLTYLVPDGSQPSPFLAEMGDAVELRLDDGPDGGLDGGGGPVRETPDLRKAQAIAGGEGAAPRTVAQVQAILEAEAGACVWCGGTGYVRETGILCRTCGGTGKNTVSGVERAGDSVIVGPLAGPTPTDVEIGPDEAPQPGAKYVPVRLAALRALLEPLGFRGAAADRGNQYVFVKSSARDGVTVRIYTTIPVGEMVSREVGEDSIRVTAIWSGAGRERAVLPREAWVCRTAGWREGILARVAKVEAALAEVPPCPDCGAPTRERKGKHGAFFGCLSYPDCRGIARRPVTPEPMEDR